VHVVATAGHVDHGKSTLVEALTGQQPDRLAEERRRGLSIRLGYCWTDLPGTGEVAFVDVPGHERFLATALAGVGPVTAVMFVVAADDPWMPQAAEHLAALDALGVEHGVLVVTRADLTDPGPALARARAALEPTSLRAVPSAVVSARTGEGMEQLRVVLAEELGRLPSPDPAAPTRLWVDRRFHVKGAGTVVTGTLSSGAIAAGDVLESDGRTVRVRGVEALGRPRAGMTAPARVALDLGGHAPSDLAAGTALVSPGSYAAASLVDVRLTSSADDRPAPPRTPLLHLGTAAAQVQVRPLDERHLRLRLDRPWPLRVGDRALLRDPGSRMVWGVEVLDPMPPPLSRRGDAASSARATCT
jgi:selenocysteine-specific elongation factor